MIRLVLSALLILLAGCEAKAPSGPVRTPIEAADVAQRTLRAAGHDEEVVSAYRAGSSWIVTTRWRESSVGGHLVTIEAATGKVHLERYRSVEIGRLPR